MEKSTTIAYNDRGAMKQWSLEEAAEFAEKMASQYAETVISLINPSPHDRVLDVGCGPGTLAIPLARIVDSVTALDTSDGMLSVLKRRAGEERLGNIGFVKGFWRGAEPGVDIADEYDIVVASNCINLLGALERPAPEGRVRIDWDLEDALLKMNRVGRRVCITMPVTDFIDKDAAAFRSVGREYYPAPTNIHVYNVIYQLGLRSGISYFLRFNKGDKAVEKYIDSLSWMLTLRSEERERVRRDTESIKTEIENSVHVWTMISWARE
jgi:SAM-dependent methyltransferase